jgi:hypothetical protein
LFLNSALPPKALGQAGHAAKTIKGPRALGLLELAPDGKARLIPITILIDGKYYDASAYKAAPVPMALWSETVYEAFRTGVSQGLFTVTGALQKKDANATEWLAEGTWQSADSIKAKVAKKKVSSVPRGLNEDEGPPVLRRAGAEKPKPTEPPAAPATPPQAQPTNPSGSSAAAPAAPAPAAAASTAPTASPSPTSSTQEQAQADQPPADQPPEDKDRPTLKRGKAGAVSAEEAQKKASADASVKAGEHTQKIPQAGATKAGSSAAQATNQVQLIPAISDSDGADPRSYAYSLTPEEEQQFRKKMLAMAADEVRARAAQHASPSAAASAPAHASSPRGKPAAVKPLQPDFEDVQLRVFDLGNVNEPELVLTAKARMPQPSHEKPGASSGLQYMITLVAREDVNGEFHKALANVTDALHLDVIPQLELIDAVDVDGDSRGELLFRQVSDAGSAFVVYRVIGDRLYPLFQGVPG